MQPSRPESQVNSWEGFSVTHTVARIDEDPDERYEAPITFTQTVICEACGADWEHTFVTDLIDIEQLEEPPEDDVECGSCRTIFHVVFEGWANYGDAG